MQHDWALISETTCSELGLEARLWRHGCGMEHWHLATRQAHGGFLLAVRTPPEDNCGAPHILEHSVLCGSQLYPVRDPFFAMLRRSLQTFMNAMTYPDHTVYPFSTQVPADFVNLLKVYVDCIFAPRLDPRNIAQEGHRLELDDLSKPQRAGVVFNEMKGAYDDPDCRVGLAVQAAMFPEVCHRFDSGGVPAEIPALRAEQLQHWHRTWYVPANAVMVSCGAMDPRLVQEAVRPYLDKPGRPVAPPAYQRPVPATTVMVPVPPSEDPSDVSSATIHWPWGDAASLDRLLDGELLERVLLGHAGSPLRRALEHAGLGRSLGTCGLQAGHRQATFAVGLAGIDPNRAEDVRALIRTTLANIAGTGIAETDISAALYQIELSRREIGGDGGSYPVELALRLVMPWNLGVDPLPWLDQAGAIQRLRTRATQSFVNGLVKELCDERFACWACAVPDPALPEREAAAEAALVARDAEAQGQTAIAAQQHALREHQAQIDDPAVLPTLTRADIPTTRPEAVGDWLDAQQSLWVAEPPANGLLHHLGLWSLPAVNDHELDHLPFLISLLGQVGVGTRDFLEESQRLQATCGGLWGWLTWGIDRDGTLCPQVGGEIKGLATSGEELIRTFMDSVATFRTDERERLTEMLEQRLQSLQERINGGGRLAALAACRGFAGAAPLLHVTTGLGRLPWLKKVTVKGPDLDCLTGLRQRIFDRQPRLAVIGSNAANLAQTVARSWSGLAPQTSFQGGAKARPIAPTAWVARGQVNHLALAFPAPGFTHPDAAALAVGCQLLTHGFLHPRIREKGGAYGAGAHYDPGLGAVILSSYRDPRLKATVGDMREGVAWLAQVQVSDRELDEAILSVIANIDAPGSPVGECRARFLSASLGFVHADLEIWRQRIMACDGAQIRRAASQWLLSTNGNIAAITAKGAVERDKLDWDVEKV